MRVVSNQYGGYWKMEVYCGDYQQWKMRGACIVAFITEES